MKKTMIVLSLLGMCLSVPGASAEWVSVTGDLTESDVSAVVGHPRDSQILYASSARRLFRSADGGAHWKQLLGVRGSTAEIRDILVHSTDPQQLYVASDKGIQYSLDEGKKWDWLYRSVGDKGRAVFCLTFDIKDPDLLWVGTSDGLSKIHTKSHDISSVNGIPHGKVAAVFMDDEIPGVLWVHSEKGIYRSEDSGDSWKRVMGHAHSDSEDVPEVALPQYQIEEMTTAMPVFSNIVRLRGSDRMFAASSGALWSGQNQGGEWVRANVSFPEKEIRYLAKNDETLYAATDRGVFEWEPSKNISREISDGLESKQVQRLWYSVSSGDLFAATKKGVFRYPKPGFKETKADENAPQPLSMDAKELLRRFENEPTILQVQNAAIQYAEVHPDKISAWRKQAARRAWLPTVSLGSDMGVDHNVDIDRGGTGDPDRFIIGPEEKNFDWHAGVSWDLGDLVWNGDQTSIDTRSRLMVELRDDVLTEVTHLYYERRRLQVEMFLTPPKELPLQLEKQIKLEELTAGIDGLTGGFLTHFIEISVPAR